MKTSVKIDFTIGHPKPVHPIGSGKIPVITRYLALAHEYNRLLDEGYSIQEIARHENIDESWLLKVVKLVYLSPRIQEMILLLPLQKGSNKTISAKQLLPVAQLIFFDMQEKAIPMI